MGDSYSVKTDTCTCEVLGAEDDDLPLHYFEELDISSCETDECDADDLDLNKLELDVNQSSIFHDLEENENIFNENGLEPLSPNSNLTPISYDNINEQLFPAGNENGNASNYSPSRKITSAMKGSREKEGKLIKSDLRVKWAPDVYDPPVTSDDHTVKRVSYKPRLKNARKDYYKQKQSKSKSSHGNKGERKNKSNSHSRSSSSNDYKMNDPRMIRSLGRHEKALTNNYASTPPKFEEFHGPDKINSNNKTKEIKFGSNFCRELVSSPLHLPLAEAS